MNFRPIELEDIYMIQRDADRRGNEDEEEEEPDQVDGIYMEKPAFVPLNTMGSIFDTKDDTSINTTRSIFDAGALFHVDD